MVAAGTLVIDIDVSASYTTVVTLTVILDAGSIIGSAQKLLVRACAVYCAPMSNDVSISLVALQACMRQGAAWPCCAGVRV